jgi:ribosomal protein S18 acetylase RimI-like enzyme
MSAEIATQSQSQSEGLSFEVRECSNNGNSGYGGDDVYTLGSPVSPVSPASDLEFDEDNCHSMLMRSDSSSVWNEPAPSPALAPEDSPKDTNISRIQLGENPETVALLHFLAGQGIDTTKLVTEHMMKYGSRVRVAQNDDGKIVGCLIFDNETDQSTLEGVSPEEIKKRVGPFIYMQILIVAPEHAVDADKHWKERLLASFLECVVKNGKIAIIRADADNHDTIQLYKSCGFFTMEDMGIPSYSSTKGNVEVLAYTPMGLEGTAQIFKKFYDMGARF